MLKTSLELQQSSAGTMKTESPYLEVISPDGEQFIVSLKDIERLTIGRSQDNDLPISDPQKFVSREHCRLECHKDYWWLYDDDNGASGSPSTSGTFVQPTEGGLEIDVRQEGRNGKRLKEGDKFFFVGKIMSPDDKPAYWQFTLHDVTTHQVQNESNASFSEQIAYSISLESLLQIIDNNREIIRLRPQHRALIRYMAQKNLTNNGQPILCKYQELIEAIWDESDALNRTNGDINHLVWGIRKEIEPDPAESKYIKTFKSEGYILDVTFIN